jgi:two-component system OmpR family response regulator
VNDMLEHAGNDSLGLLSTGRERILIVEDEPEFSSELAAMLRRYGFEVSVVSDAAQMADALPVFAPNIVILDQFLQDVDMLTRLVQIRTRFHGGLMILSGNDEITDRVLALEQGADDFVVKTTHSREVLARLRALVRRNAVAPAAPTPAEPLPHTTRDGWEVHMARREVRTPHGAVVALTGLEFDAFQMLYLSPGKVIPRESLAKEILQRHVSASGRSIENLMSRVRAKFAPFIADSPLIRSVRGKGYVFLGFP